MKNTLRFFAAAVTALFLGGLTQTAEASHWQGSELTYACVAPGVYTVTLKLYRECSSTIAASPSVPLTLKSPGCNSSGRVVTLNKVGNSVLGNAYCSQISPGCGAVYPNYTEEVYTNTLIFTSAEQSCPDWTMTWTECCRPQVANLVNPASSFLYTEAYINLTSGINNNSPEFGSLVVPFVNHSQPILLSSFATDSDEDSLVYSLKDPLENANTPVAFGSYPSFSYYNADSTKSVLIPAGNFSKTFPIISYFVNWTQPAPITPVPTFQFNTKTGSIGFFPNKYEANTLSSQGKNKYVMVVQVDEYRKINGVPTKVGSIRRDMFITVIDCGPNQNPHITAPVANGQAISENDVISLRPGSPLNFQFASSDGNAANILTLESDVETVLPGAVFTKSSASQPTGTITWTPSASAVRGQVYYFHVTVKDNACPVKGVQTHTFGVRVSATGGVTGINEISVAGNGFSVFPNPYTNDLHFKLNLKTKAESIKIYNVLGQQIDQISLKNAQAGEQNLAWKNAGKYAAGSYVAKLVSAEKIVQTLKFTKLQ